MARIIGLDVLGPLLVYRLCRHYDMSQVWALVISGTTPGLGVLIDYVRWRTLEIIGAIVLGGIALSITRVAPLAATIALPLHPDLLRRPAHR